MLHALTLIILTVIEIQSISAGHKEDITFPFEDDRELLLANRKDKIILPAELFEKQGMKQRND